MVGRSEAQIFTLEGLGAAVLIMLALYFMLQSPSVSVPPAAKYSDIQLAQLGRDVLTAMDWSGGRNESKSLRGYLKDINKSDARIPTMMREDLASMLPKNVIYNIVIYYVNLSGTNQTDISPGKLNVTAIVLKSDNNTLLLTDLQPPRDSVTASHFVVIYDSELTQMSPFKINATQFGVEADRLPHVIEVRLELWYA